MIDLIDIVQSSVLDPNIKSALWLIFAFALGEFVAFLPLTIALAGQVIFIEEAFSWIVFSKLFLYVGMPVGLGTALGSFFLYGLAYWGGRPMVQRYKKYLRFSWGDVERMQSYFKDKWYDDAIFLFLRTIPFLPTIPMSLAAGFIRMNIVPYFVLTFVGTTIRTMLMIALVGLGV